MGHGSHVAGIAAGLTYGIAKNATLWAGAYTLLTVSNPLAMKQAKQDAACSISHICCTKLQMHGSYGPLKRYRTSICLPACWQVMRTA